MQQGLGPLILSRLAALGVLCASGCTGADFDLNLVPIIPQNQSPFDDLDDLELVLQHSDGTEERHSLGPASGSPSVGSLGLLNGTRVRLNGIRDGQVVATGSTTPFSIATGETSQHILFSEVDRMAWLEDHETGFYAPGLVALGEGRFAIFGGLQLNGLGNNGRKGKKIHVLDMGAPNAELSLQEVADMPAYASGLENQAGTVTARHGASATLLTKGIHAGKVLVAGGTSTRAASEDITKSAFLYDPETHETLTLNESESMDTGHYLHKAVQDHMGNVVILGGWEPTEADFVAFNNRFDFFDASSGSFNQRIADRTLLSGGLSGMAAPLGTSGVVYCGGAVIRAGSTWESESACSLITTSGAISNEIPPLPEPLSHGSMIPLSSSELLVVGGVSTASKQDIDTTKADAVPWVFYYDRLDGDWQELTGLNLPRANAALELLPDGRVLVLGGRQSAHLFRESANDEDEVLACVEIYDPFVAINQPAQQASTLLNGCSASSVTSELPTRVHSLHTAQDPLHGVVGLGGINGDGTPTSVVHWRFPPD